MRYPIIFLFLTLCTVPGLSFSTAHSRLILQMRSSRRASSADDLKEISSDIVDRVANTDYSELVAAVVNNFDDGVVGSRGEMWVLAQFSVLVFVICGGFPFVDGSGLLLQVVASLTALVSSIVLIGGGILTLGSDLTPFPKPTTENSLQERGVYGLVRHPIYGGLLLFCFGISGLTNSCARLLFSVVLLAVLHKKKAIEEAYLRKKHGDAYDEYKKRVPAAFIPFIFED